METKRECVRVFSWDRSVNTGTDSRKIYFVSTDSQPYIQLHSVHDIKITIEGHKSSNHYM